MCEDGTEDTRHLEHSSLMCIKRVSVSVYQGCPCQHQSPAPDMTHSSFYAVCPGEELSENTQTTSLVLFIILQEIICVCRKC